MANVIVIGAGAAGMMAAYAASLCGHQVQILEKNEKAGKKIYITGKGRCNLTNASDLETIFASIVHNGKFMYSSMSSCHGLFYCKWFGDKDRTGQSCISQVRSFL